MSLPGWASVNLYRVKCGPYSILIAAEDQAEADALFRSWLRDTHSDAVGDRNVYKYKATSVKRGEDIFIAAA
jgi:hypothetical protein